MKTKTETILKYLPQYDEIMQETNAPLSQATTYTTYCAGWLSGAKAAIDAILDDSSIGLMVYNAMMEPSTPLHAISSIIMTLIFLSMTRSIPLSKTTTLTRRCDLCLH